MADRYRNSGSGYTVFRYAGNILASAEEVRVTGPAPVAPEVRIQPLNARRPVEIMTSGAHTGGSLTMVLIELYAGEVWQRLSAQMNGAQDIVDIMRLQQEVDPNGPGITVDRIINSPIPGQAQRIETYYGCKIIRVQEDETINIRSMQVNKEIEVAYTHSVKNWINGGNRARDLSPRVGANNQGPGDGPNGI